MPTRKSLFDRIPSQWRLAVLLALFVGTSTALTLVFERSTVSRDLRHFDTGIVVDDLVEYAAIYASSGIQGVREVFPAGQHSESNALRITTPEGEVLMEDIPGAMRLYRWPTKAPLAELER